jgi:hypothetical protein
LAVLAGLVGDELARRMVTDIPQSLLDGEEVELPELEAPRPKRSMLSRWFGRRRG